MSADPTRAVEPSSRGWIRTLVVIVTGALLLLAAPTVLQQSTLTKIALMLVFGLAITGLNLVAGYGGQLSLGHSAFLGVGAYATTILTTDYQLPVVATVPIAAIIGFVVGLVAGLPALRLSGHYLGLVTLGIGIAFPLIVLKAGNLTGGANGKLLASQWNLPEGGPPWLTQFSITYLVVVIITIIGVLMTWNLIRFGVTRTLIAQRENAIAASVNGVNLTREKTIAFAVSAAITSVAGSLYAMTTGVVAPEAFGLLLSIQLVTGLLVGGSATLLGPLIGGIILVLLPEVAFNVAGGTGANMVYGAVLILIMFAMPGGIVGGLRALRRRRAARRASHRPGPSSPSNEPGSPAANVPPSPNPALRGPSEAGQSLKKESR